MADSRTGKLRSRAAACCCATALVIATAEVEAQGPGGSEALTSVPSPAIRVTAQNARMQNFLHDLAGPTAVLKITAGSFIDHSQNDPEVWGTDSDAFAKRIASRAGQRAVTVGVHHGLAAVMDRSTEYQPCECDGTGDRIEHALLETFTDRRADGSRALSIPRFAGAYAGSFARLAWEPNLDAGDVAVGTTLSLGLSAVINVARELAGLR